MGRLVWVTVASACVVAVTGAPGTEQLPSVILEAARGTLSTMWFAPAPALSGTLTGSARWTESGSLLLLATGFFGAALLLRNRKRVR